MSSWGTELRRGLVELCVLAILKRGESYGYEIVEHLNAEVDLGVGESTVYPILARLHGKGLLSRRRVASATGPPRCYFQLTRTGLLRFEEMMGEWKSLNSCFQRLNEKGVQQ
jgi:PadR family transcriptional regulator PadR